ncbi:MAG: Diacylglycerol kinase [Candidatus Heimdallarchaeota archaeon LC_3]|nr:MAG: Diacylglycerol kinase [Candidatus Heimdallarchaeota archaeon LC_3]
MIKNLIFFFNFFLIVFTFGIIKLTNKRKWLAVVNPTSAGARTNIRWNISKQYLDKLDIKYDEAQSEYHTHAIHIVEKELLNYDGIIAVGGDGTVNEVINGILHTSKDKLLAIIPTGTGNDLANTFQLHLDIRKACKTLAIGKPRQIDVGLLVSKDFNNKPVNRYFGGAASFGFDAKINLDTNNSTKRLPGTWNYIRSLLKNLITLRSDKYIISYNNLVDNKLELVEKDLVICVVGNGKFYGSGIMVCPGASVTDSKFHITVVSSIGRIEIMKTFPKMYTGDHIKHPAVSVIETNEIEIKNTTKSLYQVDGEVLGYTPVKIKTIPKILNIMSPKKLPDFQIKR